ncbi:MAG: hypothetical protein DI539_18195 [Flavobacterium psychrophilum]|nr:MAG: hypothetical protein DI539_18195 [Flavobacterium psychrophilum]
MFWIKIENYGGHYYFREKSTSEKIFDLFRNDDTIKLDHYECFAIKKAHNVLSIIRLMEKLDKEPGLEIEIMGEDLFIKTLKLLNLEDFNRITKIIG